LFCVYASAMSDEWRVSLVLGDSAGVPKKVVEDLRVRLGDGVGVSGDKGHIFLYAGTEKAADEAEQVARDALAQGGQVAESSLLERWDPDTQKWRDPRVEAPEDDDDDEMEQRRSVAGAVAYGVAQVLGEIH
jgi:hypothetical protein